VILDLTGLGIGTHQITPQVEAPEGVAAQSILPATVQVTIERAIPEGLQPRSTPTPSTAPTRRP
jgi:hypothetical protein